MFRASRIVYLLVLGLLIGLAVVHLRTRGRQAIYERIVLERQAEQLRSDLWEQRALMSALLESPVRIKEQVDEMGLAVRPRSEGRVKSEE